MVLEIVNGPTGELIERPTLELETKRPVVEFGDNLALVLKKEILDEVGAFCLQIVQADLSSREEWDKQQAETICELGSGAEPSPPGVSSFDNENASNFKHPLLLRTCTKFAARAGELMLPVNGFIEADYVGPSTENAPPEQQQLAEDRETRFKRLGKTWAQTYLEEILPAYAEEFEIMLRELGRSGTGFKKLFINSDKSDPQRVCIEYVPASRCIVNYRGRNLRSIPITHHQELSVDEVVRRMADKRFCVASLEGLPIERSQSEQAMLKMLGFHEIQHMPPIEFYEVDALLFFDGDWIPNPQKVARPYVVTIDCQSNQVVRMVRNWREGDPRFRRRLRWLNYLLFPGNTPIYGEGFGHNLTNITRRLSELSNAAIDSADYQNHPSAMTVQGFKRRNQDTKIAKGEMVEVEVPRGMSLGEAVMRWPFDGPSPATIALLEGVQNQAEMLAGDSSVDFLQVAKQNVAASTVLALIDESTVVQSAVFGRLLRSLRREFKMFTLLCREAFGDMPLTVEGGQLPPGALYSLNFRPSARNANASKSRRIMESTLLTERAAARPNLYDVHATERHFLNSLGISDPDRYLKDPNKPNPVEPRDAITEFNVVMGGGAIKAGPAQNHQAHMETHLAQMRMLASSPVPAEIGQTATVLLASHIAEHYALSLSVILMGELGMPMDMLQNGIPPQIERQISPQVASLSQQMAQMYAKPTPEETDLKVAQMEAQLRAQIEQLKADTTLTKTRLENHNEIIVEAMRGQAKKHSDISDERISALDNFTAIQLQRGKLTEGERKTSAESRKTVSRNPNPGAPAPSNDRNP